MTIDGKNRTSRLVLRLAFAIGATLALVLIAAGCGGSGGSSTTATSNSPTTTTEATTTEAAPEEASPSPTFTQQNGDTANTRWIESEITPENVEELKPAWSMPLTAKGAYGTFAANPVINEGTVYVQDLESNVSAIDLETGKVEWTHKFGKVNFGPNGVVYADGYVYGETTNEVFALEAKTGDIAWLTPGLVPGPGGLEGSAKPHGALGFTIQPLVANGVLYTATATEYGGGKAYALDAKTGKVLWKFDTIVDPVAKKITSPGTGGAWNAPAISTDGETVFYGIGNPYQTAEKAISEPSKLLYADSTVALDSKTGKLKWYYQGVPNDFHDWDMQISPIYTEAEGEPVVLDAGKMGYVYAMDAETGELRWKLPVGKHNGHDDDGLKAIHHELKQTYPNTVWPGIYGGVETNMAAAEGVVYVGVVKMPSVYKTATESTGTTDFPHAKGEMVAIEIGTGKVKWKAQLSQMPLGAATVTNGLVFTTTYDGYLVALDQETGKIAWREKLTAGTNAPVAISGDTLVTAASFPQGKGQKSELVAYRLGANGEAGESSGAEAGKEQEAQASPPEQTQTVSGEDVFKSNCATCHTLAAAGAAGTVGPNLDELKPSKGLVEHQVTNGGGGMPAFGGRLSGNEIEAVAEYVSSNAGKKSAGGSEGTVHTP